MQEILDQNNNFTDEELESTDEQWVRPKTPTEYINIIPKKMDFGSIDEEEKLNLWDTVRTNQDFNSSIEVVQKVAFPTYFKISKAFPV